MIKNRRAAGGPDATARGRSSNPESLFALLGETTSAPRAPRREKIWVAATKALSALRGKRGYTAFNSKLVAHTPRERRTKPPRVGADRAPMTGSGLGGGG